MYGRIEAKTTQPTQVSPELFLSRNVASNQIKCSSLHCCRSKIA